MVYINCIVCYHCRMIKNSLEWSDNRLELLRTMHQLPYNRDLRQVLSNIDTMVSKLSMAEVPARRLHQDTSKLPELKQVNDAIETLEQWLMLAALMR